MSDSTAHAPLKVTFVLPSFAAGGAERVLITLMNSLDRARFAPSLVCLNQSGSLRDLVAPDIPVHADRNFNRVAYALPYLATHWIRQRPDIVISTMAHMNFGVLLTRPFMPWRTRVIVREAITPTFLTQRPKDGKLIRFLYRILYPRASRVICPAQCIIDEFESHVNISTKNFALLYNPVNITKIRAGTPAPANDQTIRFICAGRLHPQKGFDRLIESLPFLNMNRPWHVTIMGEGEQHAALTDLIRQHKLEDKVTLSGFAAQPWPMIGASDCFLLPSRHEGLPNVALEALCVGTPVISMREAGGIAEIAARATQGAVTLCDSMADFVAAMERVEPQKNDGTLRPSLLPLTFHPDTVEKDFRDLLIQAA